MVKRDLYLNQLYLFEYKDLVKVITGVRRCGKSYLLDLCEEYLLCQGVNPSAIIRINFKSLDFEHIKDCLSLSSHIKENIGSEDKTYILLDEIQTVSNWEKSISSLQLDKRLDIYITVSNACLSTELSALQPGSYVEIKMLPLSFKEYLDFNGFSHDENLSTHFDEYLEYGGFPGITEIRKHESAIKSFLEGTYSSIIIKDVISKNSIRDFALFESLVKFMASSAGKPISTKKISDHLTSSGRKTNNETIDNYIQSLIDASILYKVDRYDVKSKQNLKTQNKYYFVDTGIRNELLEENNVDHEFMLENIVYLELIRRGFKVSIGKYKQYEIDFVASKRNKVIYYQVTDSILPEEIKSRKLRALEAIHDNYEKVILSMDQLTDNDFDGIKHVNLIDFLLSDYQVLPSKV